MHESPTSRRECRHHSQFHACAVALTRHHRQGVAFDGIESGRDLSAIGAARFGQANAAPGAPEQVDAEKVFERRDLAAHGTLGEREFVRCAREAFMARGVGIFLRMSVFRLICSQVILYAHFIPNTAFYRISK